MRRAMGLAGAAILAATAAAAQEADVPETAQSYVVLFGFDREPMDAEGVETLSHLADDFLIGGADAALVAGYTDTVGDAAFNRGLAERRAREVRRNLLARGVPSAAIAITTFGETAPAVETPDETRERLNRRVVIEVQGFGTNPPPDPLTPVSFALPPEAPQD